MATLRGDLSTICDWPIKQNRYIHIQSFLNGSSLIKTKLNQVQIELLFHY